MAKPLTYGSYLRVDELLALQSPRSRGDDEKPEHDELLFIVIHQVYELWFHQILHELDFVQTLLRAGDSARAGHTLRRILTILKTIVSQIDVLETMTPLEFASFRSFLDSASGFQSAQFREIEFALGRKREAMLRHFAPEPAAVERLTRRYHTPTLWDAFLHYLHQAGYAIPADQLQRDVTQSLLPNEAVQAVLIEVYRTNPALRAICERLVDLDEGFQEWRYRHLKMVERTIGARPGTGGSPGAAYLATTMQALFPDLWVIRSML
ncbi:MAG: tryptophan 2,3-dioxygenase [Oscillochloris sp.]|nr:tryptophan 2,3-dioxygenase [Oscillochloris sp.]